MWALPVPVVTRFRNVSVLVIESSPESHEKTRPSFTPARSPSPFLPPLANIHAQAGMSRTTARQRERQEKLRQQGITLLKLRRRKTVARASLVAHTACARFGTEGRAIVADTID